MSSRPAVANAPFEVAAREALQKPVEEFLGECRPELDGSSSVRLTTTAMDAARFLIRQRLDWAHVRNPEGTIVGSIARTDAHMQLAINVLRAAALIGPDFLESIRTGSSGQASEPA